MARNDLTEQRHTIGLFDELVCRGAGTVHLVHGPDPGLVVIGPPDLVEKVVVRYRGTRLVVSFRLGPDPGRFLTGGADALRTIVMTDDVARVTTQGAASLRLGEDAGNPLVADSLRLVNSGTGCMTGHVSTRELVVRLNGTGMADLAGDTQVLNARLSGIGSLDCLDLVSRTARVSLSGIGNCSVMVLQDLTATVSGTGRVVYRGDARLTARGSQPGHIEHLE